MPDVVAMQREYYRVTAEQYDCAHMAETEHEIALAFMFSMIDQLKIGSVLDVGSGTGRVLCGMKYAHANVHAIGVEPSAALRKQGYAKGLRADELIDGDVQQLAFHDGEFDLVCAFAVLHHVPDPRRAVREMLRVARKAVFISDANNFGQGTILSRAIKQMLKAVGLWSIADLIKTHGRGYSISEGDGISYSYSIFDDYRQISAHCTRVHLLSTAGTRSPNLYRSAAHVALLGVKD